jgi:hypothetical protein
MIRLGWALTLYFCLSFILFLFTSNTINGGIVYLFLLLPFYGAVLLGWWIFVWKNRTKTGQINYWIWGIVLVLQVLTILVSPGNCFGAKQNARCYSNFQILIGDAPRTGPSNTPHWTLIEDAFLGLVPAYAVAVLVGLISTRKSIRSGTDEE